MISQPVFRYEPTFEIPENITLGLGDRKIGEKIRATVTYEVIEKTKNYIVLRIKGFLLNPSKRKF